MSMGEPTENEGMDQEIQIVPLLSGFRDSDNLNVDFEMDYRLLDDNAKKRLSIITRQELIESISPFDFDVYRSDQHRIKSKKDSKVR